LTIRLLSSKRLHSYKNYARVKLDTFEIQVASFLFQGFGWGGMMVFMTKKDHSFFVIILLLFFIIIVLLF